MVGGVFKNGGGGRDVAVELIGVGAVVTAARPGSIPAARKRTSKEVRSGIGVAAGVTAEAGVIEDGG